MYISGYTINNIKEARTIIADASGWKVNAGNTLKRITSIGQSSQDFYTGSFIKNVHWYNNNLYYYAVNNLITVPWDASRTQFYCSWPNSTIVQVNYVSAGEETDNIIMLGF